MLHREQFANALFIFCVHHEWIHTKPIYNSTFSILQTRYISTIYVSTCIMYFGWRKIRRKTIMFSFLPNAGHNRTKRVRNNWQTFSNWWPNRKRFGWLSSILYTIYVYLVYTFYHQATTTANKIEKNKKKKTKWMEIGEANKYDKQPTTISVHPFRRYKSWLHCFCCYCCRFYHMPSLCTWNIVWCMKPIKTLRVYGMIHIIRCFGNCYYGHQYRMNQNQPRKLLIDKWANKRANSHVYVCVCVWGRSINVCVFANGQKLGYFVSLMSIRLNGSFWECECFRQSICVFRSTDGKRREWRIA